MTTYSTDKTLFASVLKAFSPIISYYIDNAVLQKTLVHYADEFPHHILIDAEFNEVKQLLTFFFSENIIKTIDLNIYEIRQSESIPYQFYFSNREDKEDCFTVVFK